MVDKGRSEARWTEGAAVAMRGGKKRTFHLVPDERLREGEHEGLRDGRLWPHTVAVEIFLHLLRGICVHIRRHPTLCYLELPLKGLDHGVADTWVKLDVRVAGRHRGLVIALLSGLHAVVAVKGALQPHVFVKERAGRGASVRCEERHHH